MKKLLLLHFVLFLNFAVIGFVYATATQEFIYNEKNFGFWLAVNYNFNDANDALLDEARQLLPLIVSLHRNNKISDNSKIEINIGCQHMGKASLTVGENYYLEIDCSWIETKDVVNRFARELGHYPIFPINSFQAFTIQLAYISPQNDSKNELDRWFNKLDFMEDRASFHILISAGGDITQIPVWIYTYPNGFNGIRYGIFSSYNDACKAIQEIGLSKNHAQIIRMEFDIEKIGSYFYSK